LAIKEGEKFFRFRVDTFPACVYYNVSNNKVAFSNT